ncbi:MAG TPA: folylpolyglutamate synthase/dihydrofolate synthase family protein [Actinomycetota bacterium]|nr:folylpolyglutamate synthase/dihydrofolate synthase family protein [Actinomycetota bacterium]
MRYEQALAALDERSNYEATGALVAPGLERMQALMDLLNGPQASFPSIQITGTNGKTTAARVAASVLREIGLGVGTYTSPHLHSPRERMVYDREPISEAEFADTFAYLEPYLRTVDERHGPVTWFEAVTAMANVWFAERAVEAAVVEVGMGGSWDATNLVNGRVALITEVAVDHPELGATPVEIAREKAGIIKRGAVCVTGERDPAVLEVIRRRCGEVGATLRRIDAEFAIEKRALAMGGTAMTLRVGERVYRDVFLPLFGAHLAHDAAVALAGVVAFLGDRDLHDGVVANAFAAVTDPGRVEVVQRRPLIVLDGAHNPDAARALAETMAESFQFDRLTLVAGMLAGKDVEGTMSPLAALATEVIATVPPSGRAVPAEVVAAAVEAFGTPVRVIEDPRAAFTAAVEGAGDRDAVLVAGSLYLVAAVRGRA